MRLNLCFISNDTAASNDAGISVLSIDNDCDLSQISAELRQQIAQSQIIALHFPKFTDGRAFSQAVLLRRRLGFTGELRATGEIALDSLQQLARTGFNQVLLPNPQECAKAQKVLDSYNDLYSDFYQGDAVQALPLFARVDSARSSL